MKTTYYLFSIFSFLIISCSSNKDDEVNTGDDLISIAQKLELLQTDFINESNDNLDLTQYIRFSATLKASGLTSVTYK